MQSDRAPRLGAPVTRVYTRRQPIQPQMPAWEPHEKRALFYWQAVNKANYKLFNKKIGRTEQACRLAVCRVSKTKEGQVLKDDLSELRRLSRLNNNDGFAYSPDEDLATRGRHGEQQLRLLEAYRRAHPELDRTTTAPPVTPNRISISEAALALLKFSVPRRASATSTSTRQSSGGIRKRQGKLTLKFTKYQSKQEDDTESSVKQDQDEAAAIKAAIAQLPLYTPPGSGSKPYRGPIAPIKELPYSPSPSPTVPLKGKAPVAHMSQTATPAVQTLRYYPAHVDTSIFTDTSTTPRTALPMAAVRRTRIAISDLVNTFDNLTTGSVPSTMTSGGHDLNPDMDSRWSGVNYLIDHDR